MEFLLSDLRYALRSLRHAPAFSLVVVVTLALGVGASTAGFTLANWLIFQPLPGVRDADRIAVVWFGENRANGFLSQYPVSASQMPALTGAVPALHSLTGYRSQAASVAARGRARRVDLEFVMPGYFTALGARPEVGRLLSEDDDVAPSGIPVAVIGHDLWLDLFEADPVVVRSSSLW
ncbi:MAG: ABC transporter permease [Gemmatimonadetes bacterium]|nr:ABC transporter permease [Gemmatimonadota bacterium]MBI2402379.1 ABC transporter permease [Gemmatimonadota bacterium]